MITIASFVLTPTVGLADAASISGVISPYRAEVGDLSREKDGDGIDGSLRLSLADPQVQEQAQSEAAAGTSEEELAKKLANPLASLISVPLQFNIDQGLGDNDATKVTLNIQPVIPITLNDNWNLILRTIIPVVYQESLTSGISSQAGLGDTLQSLFFSPSQTVDGFTWGVGPALLYPTATDELLGGEKWCAGPTAVVLKQEKGWTYGALANHLWSFAGDDDRPYVNATFLQPFISYTWPTATTLKVNTESTFDWNNEEWTIPLNVTVAQLVKFGDQRVQFEIGGRWFIKSPDDGPEWGIRFAIVFLFPK